MPTSPEFDLREVFKEADDIFAQAKRDLTPYATEFSIGVAQSFFVMIQTEKDYVLKGLSEGSLNDIEELTELETKFNYDYARLDPAIDSAVIDLRGKDIDRINTILFSYLPSEDTGVSQNTLQAIHEVNQAFIEAGGEVRAPYEDFFRNDVEAA